MIGFKDATVNNTITTPSYVDISDGTSATNVISPGTTPAGVNALLTAGTYWTPTDFTPTALNQNQIYDVGAFKSVSLTQMTSGTTATVAFQVSNDPTFSVNATLFLNLTTTTIAGGFVSGSTQFANTQGQASFSGSLQGYRYFRLYCTAYTAQPTFKICFSATPAAVPPAFRTPTPIAADPSSSYGALTYIGAVSSGYNGWVGGVLTQIKATAGLFFGAKLYNPNAFVVYVGIFNASSITYGTTVPLEWIEIPATSYVSFDSPLGTGFSSAMYYTVSTSPTTLTAPGAAIQGTARYI